MSYSLLPKRFSILLVIELIVPPVKKKKTTAITATMKIPQEKRKIASFPKKQL